MQLLSDFVDVKTYCIATTRSNRKKSWKLARGESKVVDKKVQAVHWVDKKPVLFMNTLFLQI